MIIFMIISLPKWQKLDMLEKKMEVLDKVDLYVGKYFSQDYVMRQLLQFTEQEIVEMKSTDSKRNQNRSSY